MSSREIERQFKALERAEKIRAIKGPAIIFVAMMGIFAGVSYLNHQANQHDAAVMKPYTERPTQQVPAAIGGVINPDVNRCPGDDRSPTGAPSALSASGCANSNARPQP